MLSPAKKDESSAKFVCLRVRRDLAGISATRRLRFRGRLENYCSFAYSALAAFRMGMSGSASFQRERNPRKPPWLWRVASGDRCAGQSETGERGEWTILDDGAGVDDPLIFARGIAAAVGRQQRLAAAHRRDTAVRRLGLGLRLPEFEGSGRFEHSQRLVRFRARESGCADDGQPVLVHLRVGGYCFASSSASFCAASVIAGASKSAARPRSGHHVWRQEPLADGGFLARLGRVPKLRFALGRIQLP